MPKLPTNQEIIEDIRTARAIMEIGWPLSDSLNSEVRMAEAIIRANLTVGVLAIVTQGRQLEVSEYAPSDNVLLMDLVKQMGDTQAHMNSLLETLDGLRSVLDALVARLGRPYAQES